LKKQKGKLAAVLLLLVITVLASSMITLAYAEQTPEVLVRQYEDKEVDTSGDFAVVLKDGTVPMSSIAAPGGWSYLNLIFAFAGAVTALVICIHILAKKQRVLTRKNIKSGDIKPLQFLLAPFFAIAGIILFTFTQDLNATMITADELTIAHATIFICTLLSSIMVHRREKYGDDDLQKDG